MNSSANNSGHLRPNLFFNNSFVSAICVFFDNPGADGSSSFKASSNFCLRPPSAVMYCKREWIMKNSSFPRFSFLRAEAAAALREEEEEEISPAVFVVEERLNDKEEQDDDIVDEVD